MGFQKMLYVDVITGYLHCTSLVCNTCLIRLGF